MSLRPRIDFAIPGDLQAPTGGYGYDRRVIAELTALGCHVRPIALPAAYPYPDRSDLAETQRLLAQADRDALIIDGLAFGALPPDLIAALVPRPIALVHHPLCLESGLASVTIERLRASEYAALEMACAIVTTSRMTSDIVAREFSVSSDRLFVATPGVDAAPRASKSSDGIVRLFAAGSVTPRKGYADLVHALADVDGDWRLTIAGSRDHAPEHARMIAALVDEAGLSARIILAGALSAAEVGNNYRSADAFVTASHFEGFGMAIAEAVSHGLPIVAAHEVAVAGAAPPDATLAYPAGNIGALADALRRLVHDAALRNNLSDAAWRAAADQARWSTTAEGVLCAVRYAIGQAKP